MANEDQPRKKLGSRLGFLLLSAGCAVGLGNVWRFPFITGQYGGAVFVGFYLLFLLAVMPVLVMEFAVGRASNRNLGLAFHRLEPAGTKWHSFGWISLAGSYILMMFYATVTGWFLLYCWYMASGQLAGLAPDAVASFFSGMLGRADMQVLGMTMTVVLGFGVCAIGLRRGVERTVKIMMLGLFALLVVLVVRSLMLPGAMEGVRFYLVPDFARAQEAGLWNVCSAAMNQAFFTLSIGIGSMAVFGSYLQKTRSLTGEATVIIGLDTFVAIMAGLVIFPACYAFGVKPGAGPGLIFISLPNVFNAMAGGQMWGTLFFIFMAFAALSTVIAVFENIISYSQDVWGIPRRRAAVLHMLLMWICALPCALGFNELSFIKPFGGDSCILDLEDFIVSNNLLPLGSLLLALFCCWRRGWGWEGFIAEVDSGTGMKFPRWMRFWATWGLPVFIVVLFIVGYVDKFCK
ncbi:MAG: sodium-dependent transporter [Desulfovibrio sp.]|nr:sodium-dependent transporter [Desulfovibrio sp.]